MQNLYVIVGLGNPGNKYDSTRHNVGFNTIDFLAQKYGISVTKLKHKALLGDGSIEGSKVLLVKPQTFMNLSGESVREIIEWHKTPLSNLIIVYDDIDIEPGKIRVRAKGSAGTHNGMRSIIYHLIDDGFPRVRIGIGKPQNEGFQLADYVLGRFGSEERKLVDESIKDASDAVIKIIKNGVEAAMNSFNKR